MAIISFDHPLAHTIAPIHAHPDQPYFTEERSRKQPFIDPHLEFVPTTQEHLLAKCAAHDYTHIHDCLTPAYLVNLTPLDLRRIFWLYELNKNLFDLAPRVSGSTLAELQMWAAQPHIAVCLIHTKIHQDCYLPAAVGRASRAAAIQQLPTTPTPPPTPPQPTKPHAAPLLTTIAALTLCALPLCRAHAEPTQTTPNENSLLQSTTLADPTRPHLATSPLPSRMSYTVLARRYRSQDFAEVIGQEPIAKTLQNAIAANRVAHAYLFCGTRGVGKTTMARLFAKALNGGTPEIDNLIMQGKDTDVIEIDAASNTGVDNARELIANSMYRPLRGKYKVYIIDEVHMLSNAAFNALLKTMEEPPEHVKFILCTTDPHKVLPTIQSRCQRFDFRNIPASLIAKHLADVLEQEKTKADPELLHQVALLGNGSMRDALTLMDRLLATGEKKLNVKLLEELLGLPERDVVSRLIGALAEGDADTALTLGGDLLAKGTAIDQVIETLLLRLRDLMVLASCGPNTQLVDLSQEARQKEVTLAQKFDAAGLVHMIALCENVQRAAKSSSVPRALFDAMLVRLAMTEKLADVTAVVTGRAIRGTNSPNTPALAKKA